jgi:hypothetical protein
VVSILPSERTPFDVLGRDVGNALQQVLPGAVQQGYMRQQGLNAIDQLQSDLAQSGGDISKMLPALARAYTLNPNLERSGIGQSAMGFAKAGNLYGNQASQGLPSQQPQQQQENQPRPTAYNIETPDTMDAQARRDAQVTGDPAQYQRTLSNLQTKNDISKQYKQDLESAALREGISAKEMPDFMEVGEKFSSQNPDQWLKNTRAAYAPIKSKMDSLEKEFIPGLGSGLLGRDREGFLKRIQPDVKDLVDMGREKQAREYLASQYLSPTEIAEQIHPIDKRQEAALSRLPKGVFPAQKKATYGDVADVYRGKIKQNPFISYENAVKNDPKGIQVMQDRLSDFFLKNVDDDTSLLTLANKIWSDKDYNWQQIAPAIRQAQKKGLKLNSAQGAELPDLAQPPIQSLPDIFQDWWRPLSFLRGQK